MAEINLAAFGYQNSVTVTGDTTASLTAHSGKVLNVAGSATKTQAEINTKENKDLLEKLAQEEAQIEESIKIKNSINQIELDELNRVKQFYIELKKASYEFNRSIGYGIQFADMTEVSAALKDKREAEITISKNRDEILKNPKVKEIKYDPTDQTYKVQNFYRDWETVFISEIGRAHV